MNEAIRALQEIAGIPQQIEALQKLLSGLFLFVMFNLALTFAAAHRAARSIKELRELKAYLQGQRDARQAAD
jgi:hypothetical protein